MSKVLTSQTIKEIDHWLGKFPKGKQRSAIMALFMLLNTKSWF